MDFAVRKALEQGRPMVMNLSFGNTYGSHDGGGLLERYLDSIAQMGQFVFVAGSGNEGDSGGHARPVIEPGDPALCWDIRDGIRCADLEKL